MIGHQREIRARVTVGRQMTKQQVFTEREGVINWLIEQLSSLTRQSHFQIVIAQQGKAQQEIDSQDQAQIFDPYGYDIGLMKEQLLLFDRQQEMINYIETEKILAPDPIKQLTALSLCLLKLGKSLMESSRPLLAVNPKQQSYSRQKLDQIQSQCMKTLIRVQQQRKRIQNCCICLTTRSSTIIQPCMHFVLCSDCASPALQKCPICSQPIINMREVYQ